MNVDLPLPPPFGTKTIYTPGPVAAPDESPLHVSFLARHGTRNPTRSSVARMRAVAAKLAKVGADKAILEKWEAVLDGFASDPGGLTWHGRDEMFGIGLRFRERYGVVFEESGREVRVRSSFKPRATASAEAFVAGYTSVDADVARDARGKVESGAGAGLLRVVSSDDEGDNATADANAATNAATNAIATTTATTTATETTTTPKTTAASKTASSLHDQATPQLGGDPSTSSVPHRETATRPPLPIQRRGQVLGRSDLWTLLEEDMEHHPEEGNHPAPASPPAPTEAPSAPASPDHSQDDLAALLDTDLVSTSSVSSACDDDEDGRGERVVDLLAAALAKPPVTLPPRIDVLPEGDDAPLRFFDYHAGYAAFARAHKVEQRARLSRSPSIAAFSGSSGGADPKARLGARLAAAFGVDVADPERARCLDSESIRVLAEAAAFDCAHGRAESVFASVLTEDDIRYLEDFEWRYRPFFEGHERFGSVTAPLVKDLMDSLTAVVDGDASAKPHVAADLRFAHAETLVPLLLLLGINENGLPRSDPGYRRGLSAISPFAANITLELFAPAPDAPDTHRVRVRLHEHYLNSVPALEPHGGATTNGYIPLDKMVDFFQKVLDENAKDDQSLLSA